MQRPLKEDRGLGRESKKEEKRKEKKIVYDPACSYAKANTKEFA